LPSMSDYGDDYSDYGDDWLYVDDEYMAADDLAEHAVASPPPTTYGDDDAQQEWDRFDYFNDLEYASDGYDDATFQPHNAKDAQIGQKRKRVVRSGHSSKKPRTMERGPTPVDTAVAVHSPVVWRSQSDRQPEQKLLADDAQSYAVLKNWREKLADTPNWARGSPPAKPPSASPGKANAPHTSEVPFPASALLDDTTLADEAEVDREEMDQEDHVDISQDALMAALQRQLAAAGGPLSGMDPQQLLQFAMRMATDKDAGDDIAGEMAEAMLEGEEDEDDEDAEENLLSWVAQQRSANNETAASEPKSPDTTHGTNRPPTPPSSEANRSVKAVGVNAKSGEAKSKSWAARETKHTQPAASLKRKAGGDDEAESSTKTTKKRATRSFDAPTATSQARNAPTRATRATRSKR
jgi:site-specific DNA-cytosine methylase